jgi:hypothetical protein
VKFKDLLGKLNPVKPKKAKGFGAIAKPTVQTEQTARTIGDIKLN